MEYDIIKIITIFICFYFFKIIVHIKGGTSMGFESTLYLNMYSILILGIVLFNLYKKYGINNKVTKWFVAMIFVTIIMLFFDSLGLVLLL